MKWGKGWGGGGGRESGENKLKWDCCFKIRSTRPSLAEPSGTEWLLDQQTSTDYWPGRRFSPNIRPSSLEFELPTGGSPATDSPFNTRKSEDGDTDSPHDTKKSDGDDLSFTSARSNPTPSPLESEGIRETTV